MSWVYLDTNEVFEADGEGFALDDRLVCCVAGFGDEIEARGTLIASAPDLLEALYDIRNRILCPVGPSPTLDEVQEIASAAIRKARGQHD